MMTSKMNATSAVKDALLKRKRHPLVESSPPPSSSWERETGRGIHHVFGEYHLDISTSCTPGETTTVVIQEDCSSIATRVWDCPVVTTKWLEHRALVLGDRNDKKQPLLSSSSWSSSHLNLHDALQLPSSSPEDSSRPPIQVLELGSGTGLLSICLAKMGAAVLSTEYGSSVAHLQKNCERNHVTVTTSRGSSSTNTTTLTPGCVVCRELDWHKTTETLRTLLPKEADRAIFDLIAVTDCSLSIKDSMGVLDMIQKYGTPGHTKVLVGLCREREGTPFFIESAQKLFPQRVTTIPTVEYPAEYQTKRQTILLIQL